MVQNIRGPKLLQLGHHVSICRKLSRLHQNNIHKCQNTEICGKTFMFQAKTTKAMKILALKRFILYGTWLSLRINSS